MPAFRFLMIKGMSARMLPQVRPSNALMSTSKIIARQLKTNAFYNIRILDWIITNNSIRHVGGQHYIHNAFILQ